MHYPATPATTTPVSSSLSLGPSDSVSQGLAGSIGRAPGDPPSESTSRSITRPSHLPLAVLWTYEDCKHDPQVGLTENNRSRLPTHRVIRHENGTLITPSQWKLIRASTCAVARSTLANLFSSDPRAAGCPRKKKYFKTYFLEEWESALIRLELAAPLLTLCAGHWKADLTLGTILSDGHLLPSRPSSPQPSRFSSQTSHLSSQPSRLSSQPSSAPDSLGRQTQKMSVGSKSKRVRDLSPPPQLRKKAKSVGHGDSRSGKYTLYHLLKRLTMSQAFQAVTPRPRRSSCPRPQRSSTWLGLPRLRNPGLDL